MHRMVLILLGFLLATAPSGAAIGQEREDRDHAMLRLAGTQPVELRGLHFRPLERVRLTVVSQSVRRERSVRASRAGRFAATFAGLPYDRCDGLFAAAVGAGGSRATLKRPHPACPPG